MHRTAHHTSRTALLSAIAVLLAACSASNCPLESTVTCNYGFYDSQGIAITYGDTITVTTLLPGTKIQYTYRRLGYTTYITDHPDSSLLAAGYTETQAVVRRDTILVNKLANGSTLSLPMHYFSTSDTVIFTYAGITGRDTLYIEQDSYSYVDLPECGTHRFHTLKSIRATEAAIDHVEIVNPQVDYKGKENIRIYFNGEAEE